MEKLLWRNIASSAAFHFARALRRGPRACRVHTHDFAELFWIEDGHAVHRVNEQRQPIQRGTLVLIRPEDRHGFAADERGFVMVNLAFPAESADFLGARYFRHDRRWFWTRGLLPYMQTLTGAQLRWLRDRAEQLVGGPATRLGLERFLLDLLDELAASTTADFSRDDCPEWLRHALERIRDPQHFVAGTRELAHLAGRTPEHVAREVKQRLGVTPTDLVNRARLDWAARQLQITTRKIIAIALECGFHNLSHFHLVFRRQFGVTPRQYRLRHQVTVR